MESIKSFAVLLILIFSVCALPLFSEEDGSAYLSLRDIDSLIEQTDYDRALSALSSYIRRFPDDLDSAQKRIDLIMRARSYYVRLADELLDVMEREPDNVEKKLDIISRLEALEKHPSAEHLAFIAQAKTAAEFTYYRAQFRKIMENAARSTEKQKYEAALAEIKKGFYMYRDEFYEQNPRSVTDGVSRNTARLEGAMDSYSAAVIERASGYREFVAAVESGSYAQASRAFPAFERMMQGLADLRAEILSCGEYYRNTAEAESGEVSYLSFMQHFALGSASIPNSGILGALDFEWNLMTENSERAVLAVTQKKYDAFSRDPENSAAALGDMERFAQLGKSVGALYEKIGKRGDSYAESMEYASRLFPATDSSLNNLGDFKRNSAALSSLSRKSGPDNDGAYVERNTELIARLSENGRLASENLGARWFLENEADGNWLKASGYFRSLNERILGGAAEGAAAAWNNKAAVYKETAEGILNDEGFAYGEAERLAGEHYASEAEKAVLEIQRRVDGERKTLLALQDDLSKSPAECGTAAKESLSAALAFLDDSESEGNGILLSVRQEILLSESARTSADEAYSAAVRNFQRENFSGARESLQRARGFYNESLSHQESASLRESSDRNLSELGARINDAENRIIVTEVRELKTRAKNEYYAGNFESAENYLNRAENRWAVTNVEPDEEIRNLKLLVQNALSMKTGRDIKPTAPLYPEMSQILSNAHLAFDKGSSLLKRGDRSGALLLFDEAKKKLQELQLVYPLNREAALLTLRIDETLDPVQFNESFSRRVQAARQNVRVPATQQQAYSDLLDLAEIRPDYPGLKELIYNVEIDLGIRQKPVDQSGRRRSESLTKEAEQLYRSAGGNEEILRQALARLDQAIVLNPDNESAIMMKDRIQIAVGGKAAVVLSSADETSYNQAIAELRNNNIMGAYTIVEQLLQKQSNRRSSKILDLQKQIQARL